MIEFHLDQRSGAPAYLQIAQQVRQSLRLEILRPGDQLPSVREVVGRLAINPNTVLKAYRELEIEGLVAARPGQGTFVVAVPEGASLADHEELRAELARWLRKAYAAGLNEEDVMALFSVALRPSLPRLAEEGAA